MARMTCVESGRKVGGWLSNVYESDYIVEKNDGSCRKVFTTYEEANLYKDYLQQQENQERLVFEQKRTADETAALRKAVEEQNRLNKQRSPFPPFPHTPPVDPEYLEWKREKARIAAEQRAMQEKQRLENERKENARLYDIALQIECGRMSYNNDVAQILKKNIYTFTNTDVILMLAENVRYNFEFSIMIKNYGKIKGVYEKLLVNPNLSSCPYEIKELALANKGKFSFLFKLFSNRKLASKCEDAHAILHDDILTLKQLLANKLLPVSMINWAEERVFEVENKDRILNGTIYTQKDLAYAEKHFYESKKYKFIKYLARKSSNQSILSSISIDIRYSKELTTQEKNDLYLCLLENVHLVNKNYILSCLIESLTDKALLERIENYCTDSLYTRWLDRMQQLGYIDKWQRKVKVNQRYPTPPSGGCSGCLVAIVVFAIPIIIINLIL